MSDTIQHILLYSRYYRLQSKKHEIIIHQVRKAHVPFMTYSFSCEPSFVIAIKRLVNKVSVWTASSVLVTLQREQKMAQFIKYEFIL